jgi:hypothetical protein
VLLSTLNFQLSTIILVIRVLCIGNSFSWDAVEQELVPLCDAKDVQVEVHNLYYGGCSLQQHAQFLLKDTAAYSHRVCTNAEPRVTRDTVTLRQALRDGTYDYISFQQASHDSGIRDSYEPWLTLLIDTVRAYQPDAQLCWMQTWAYSQDAKHPAFPRYHNSQAEMWDSIQSCTRYVRQIVNNKQSSNQSLNRKSSNRQLIVLPCGEAIQRARSTRLGDTLCRDGYHLNYIYGRYTAACVWYEIITGKDVRCNRYKNPQMTPQQRRLTQKSAHQAVKNRKK